VRKREKIQESVREKRGRFVGREGKCRRENAQNGGGIGGDNGIGDLGASLWLHIPGAEGLHGARGFKKGIRNFFIGTLAFPVMIRDHQTPRMGVEGPDMNREELGHEPKRWFPEVKKKTNRGLAPMEDEESLERETKVERGGDRRERGKDLLVKRPISDSHHRRRKAKIESGDAS